MSDKMCLAPFKIRIGQEYKPYALFIGVDNISDSIFKRSNRIDEEGVWMSLITNIITIKCRLVEGTSSASFLPTDVKWRLRISGSSDEFCVNLGYLVA